MEQELLEKILSEIRDVKYSQISLDDKIDSMSKNINTRFDKLESKANSIAEQVASLTEFKVEVNQKLTAVEGGKK